MEAERFLHSQAEPDRMKIVQLCIRHKISSKNTQWTQAQVKKKINQANE